MSRLIGEPLAYHATKEFFGPLSIVNAVSNALAITEIKLGNIAMKVTFFAMLIYTFHATFKDREKALNGVGMYRPISERNLLTSTMSNAAMFGKMFM
jgi:hypothetical protein